MRLGVAVATAVGLLVACAPTGAPRSTGAVADVVEAYPAAAPPAAPAVPPPLPEATPPPPPPPPPRPSYLAAGVHQHQVEVDGHHRRWTTVVPGGDEGRAPDALVVVLHGVGGSGADMRSAGFEPLAAASRIVVAYPDAFGGAWNDGRPGVDPAVPGVTVDDTRFLRLLLEETTARTGVDPRRVAVVGFSNGAVMAGRLACDLSERVATFALVGGAGGQGFEQSCRPARAVSMMLVAGSNDRTVPYAGGRVANWGTRRRGYVAPVDDFFAFWRGQSACTAVHSVPSPVQVSVARGADCRDDTSVVRYRVNGGGHEWFQPPTFDTTNMIWEFLARRLGA